MATLPFAFTTSVSGATLTLSISASASYPDPITNFDMTLGYQTGIATYVGTAGGAGFTVLANPDMPGSVTLGGFVSDGGNGSSGGPLLASLTFTLTGSVTDFPLTLTDADLNNDAPAAGSADPSVPCFALGTRIATPLGEVPVEALRIGDLVATVAGGHRAVVWIGSRRIDCRRHPRADAVRPIRVLADAFGADAAGLGLPRRDLLLSPDHAVFAEGALIPVKCLVNGRTIAPAEVDAVTYFHVELAQHDVVLAEGLACESYLDTGNRTAFANGEVAVQMFPEFANDADHWEAAWAARAYAPIAWDGPIVAALRARLAAQATALGFAATAEPELRLWVDGRAVPAEPAGGDMVAFRVPAGARTIRLRSRSGVPAEHDPTIEDARRLGVAVGGAWIDAAVGASHEVALDDPALGDGFWPVERDAAFAWRWTDGDAMLDPALFRGDPGGVVLRLRLIATQPSWLRGCDGDSGARHAAIR